MSSLISFDPTQINPLFIILISAAIYGLLAFVRSQIASIVALGLGLFCLSFLLLPSGHSNLQAAHRLPSRVARVQCMALALTKGAPIRANAAKEIESCHFRGQGVGDTNEEALRELLKVNGPALRSP